MAVKALLTLEEFARLPDDDGFKYELDEGELITMSPPNVRHGWLQLRIAHILQAYLDVHPLGRLTSESGFVLNRTPDTCRGPDIAFMSNERISGVDPESWPEGGPDLAIEIISPSDRPEQMRRKISQYLNAGTQIVWVVYPKSCTVRVHDSAGGVRSLGLGETLTAPRVLPGFELPLDRIFEGL